MADHSFEEKVLQILQVLWQDDPVFATSCGIHDYDHRLSHLSKEAIETHTAHLREFIRQLEQMGQRPDPEEEGDRQALLAVIKNGLIDWEEIGWHRKEPALYADHALYGLYLLIAREFAPLEQRLASVKDRLQEVCRLLKESQETIEPHQVPSILVETALESARGAGLFFAEVIPEAADRVSDSGLRREVLKSNDEAAQAFRDWEKWLKEEVAPRAAGHWGVGRDLFLAKLRQGHLLEAEPEELKALGEEVLAQTVSQMAELALRLDPLKNWKELVEEKKAHHPPENQILDTYRKEVERARQFVLERGIVGLPENDRLSVVETPSFDRPTTPYAAYVAPAPFDEKSEGLFYVTPVNGKEPPEVRMDRLKGHCIYSLPIVVVHEAYPGHHLQLSIARGLPSLVRKVFGDTVSIEGWALYCEEMMLEQGYSDDPIVRLFQLKDLLWRAVRVIVDVGLHCHGMTPQQAAGLLVSEAHIEPANAVAEVRRYCASPTQPLSYLTGKMQILRLRQEAERKLGGQFQLKDFHDRLLRTCNWPIPLVRPIVLGGS
ncbi:MAG: DUF885 domain-containing protein [Armatimonadetes bacterium]|nr:DUF885 domain-containing protein [Armatimonadota bacterium]MDW8121858.1 DUF885 domain-containing protein [Armatimonadota bacterium]